jgi:type VI protein secretion system component VasA
MAYAALEMSRKFPLSLSLLFAAKLAQVKTVVLNAGGMSEGQALDPYPPSPMSAARCLLDYLAICFGAKLDSAC